MRAVLLERPLDLRLEGGGVDRRIAKELVADAVEQPECKARLHESGVDHGAHVLEILLEAALDLRQRLRVRIEMMHIERTFADHERAPLPPSR